jgi:hypothetical protein
MENIKNQIKDISLEDIEKDYEKLTQIDITRDLYRIYTGNKVVDYFTLKERLYTRGNKGINFYDFLATINKYNEQRYYINFMENVSKKNKSEIRNQYDFFKLYMGSISIFKPLNAMTIYHKYKPKIVLDFTMGWGGRCVGACASGIRKYIGIDANTRLIKPYREMKKFLKTKSTTKLQFYFTDCLNINYKLLKYDLVLTSPPYWNLETYGDEIIPFKNKQQWIDQFYNPIFRNTYNNLDIGGHYCLNVNKEIYERVCIPLMGEATEKIPLCIEKRGNYMEYIYIWKKTSQII